MTSFLVESYLPRTRAGELSAAAGRMRQAADELATATDPVRYVRSTFVPEDEICVRVFEAASIEAVKKVLGRAGLSYDRIVEAVESQ